MIGTVSASSLFGKPSETMLMTAWSFDGELFVCEWTHKPSTWRLLATDSQSFQVYENRQMKYRLRWLIRRVR